MAAIRNFLTATFLGTRRNDYKVPENSIRMVDSRAWDPEWYYRDRHRFLTIALRQLWGRKVFKDLWVTNEEVFEHILYLTGMSWRLVRFLRSPRFGEWRAGNANLEAEMGLYRSQRYWSAPGRAAIQRAALLSNIRRGGQAS